MEQLIDFHAPEVQAVLDTLLKDKSTGKNIIWATDPPEELQTVMYEPVTDKSQITTQQLGLTHYEVVLPRMMGVNEKLRDIAAEYANEPDLPVVDDIHVRDILLDSGVSQERAEEMQMAYREATQNKPIMVNNLIDSKTTISLDGITVSIGKDATDKVRTQCVNGRRYLLIDLDDPAVEINGLTARIAEQLNVPETEESTDDDE